MSGTIRTLSICEWTVRTFTITTGTGPRDPTTRLSSRCATWPPRRMASPVRVELRQRGRPDHCLLRGGRRLAPVEQASARRSRDPLRERQVRSDLAELDHDPGQRRHAQFPEPGQPGCLGGLVLVPAL